MFERLIEDGAFTWILDKLKIRSRILLPQVNDAAKPTLAFGDGDSGFYEATDDQLYLSLGGGVTYVINNSYIYTAIGGAALKNILASATVPSFVPTVSDEDTGIGSAATDALSLIAGGVEGHRITEAAGAIDHILTGIVKTPTTQTLTGAGAVDIVSAITHLVTAGVGDALTLANGAEGQVKTILTKTETTAGDTSVLTPTSFANGATITFDAPGDIAQLLFTNGAWHYIGGVGGVIG